MAYSKERIEVETHTNVLVCAEHRLLPVLVIDGLTYLASAILLLMIKGNYNVTSTSDKFDTATAIDQYHATTSTTSTLSSSMSTTTGDVDDNNETLQQESKSLASSSSPWDQFVTMTKEGTSYLRSTFLGTLVFVKATGALGYGAGDVLNVAFSELQPPSTQGSILLQQPAPTGDQGNYTYIYEDYNDDNDAATSQRLGILFACMGVGCLLGPIIAERWHDLSEEPSSVQRSCIMAFGFLGIGLFGWGCPPEWFFVSIKDENSDLQYYYYFLWLCICAMVRSSGSSILWINSSLLLQKFASPEMLGRVMAADFALALLAESISAFACGILMNHWPTIWTANSMSVLFGCISFVWMFVWWGYHSAGGGAASPEASAGIVTKDKSVKGYQTESNGAMPNSESTPLLP